MLRTILSSHNLETRGLQSGDWQGCFLWRFWGASVHAFLLAYGGRQPSLAFLGSSMCHSILYLLLQMAFSPVSVYLCIVITDLRPTLIQDDLISRSLLWLYLQRLLFHMRSRSEIPHGCSLEATGQPITYDSILN